MSKEVWLVSTNEERWGDTEEFETKKDAIKYGPTVLCITNSEESFYVGRKGEFVLTVNVDYILRQISEDAGEVVGELSDGWPCLNDEDSEKLKKELNAVIMRYIDEPTFWPIEDVEQIWIDEIREG